jgi:hypothetical protein
VDPFPTGDLRHWSARLFCEKYLIAEMAAPAYHTRSIITTLSARTAGALLKVASDSIQKVVRAPSQFRAPL